MKTTEINVWPQNNDVAERLLQLANKRNIYVRHNTSSAVTGPFDGHHRWVLLRPDHTNYSIRSKDCLGYSETRYARYFKPSIIGERQAIQELIDSLLKEQENGTLCSGNEGRWSV